MISVDLDSTLNDLMYKWIGYINERSKSNYSIKDIKIFDDPILINALEFVERDDLYSDLSPLIGANDFLDALKKIDEVQIVSVTSENHFNGKQEFIKKYFPETKFILVQESKIDTVDGTILIDDKLSTVIEHSERGNLGIVFNNNEYIYNKTPNHFSGGYDKIIEYLEGACND